VVSGWFLANKKSRERLDAHGLLDSGAKSGVLRRDGYRSGNGITPAPPAENVRKIGQGTAHDFGFFVKMFITQKNLKLFYSISLHRQGENRADFRNFFPTVLYHLNRVSKLYLFTGVYFSPQRARRNTKRTKFGHWLTPRALVFLCPNFYETGNMMQSVQNLKVNFYPPRKKR